ncbi:MAG: HU family DNA-binding protein [Erysipelothrix sp.]|nr:HU family DNA-binding protein [Erysipelothrix sp.]
MSKILNKKLLTDRIAEEFEKTKKESGEIVNFILDEFTGMLAEGGTVEMSGFGKFEVRHRPERPGINPATKERITIKASNTPAFRAAKALRDAVNE